MSVRLTNTTNQIAILNKALRDISDLQKRVKGLEASSDFVTYIPKVVASTGTYTTVVAQGRYQALGKYIFVHIRVTFTTIGTGTFPVLSLPIASNGYSYVLTGVDTSGTTGKMCSGQVDYKQPGLVILRNYDNTTPAVNGVTLHVSGFYEAIV
jgi:hypothetical protein